MEYWIEGLFEVWWTGKSFYCSDLDIFIPKWAILNLDVKDSPGEIRGKVMINSRFAESQIAKLKTLQNTKKFSWQNKNHYYLFKFCNALNKPYEQIEKYEELEPPPTALP